jgi:plasmid maintenance system antidote protein VapI
MNRLAQALHVPANRISGIVAGQRGITVETALRLARYFNTTPGYWINMQASMNSKPRAMNGMRRSNPKYAPRGMAIRADVHRYRSCPHKRPGCQGSGTEDIGLLRDSALRRSSPRESRFVSHPG